MNKWTILDKRKKRSALSSLSSPSRAGREIQRPTVRTPWKPMSSLDLARPWKLVGAIPFLFLFCPKSSISSSKSTGFSIFEAFRATLLQVLLRGRALRVSLYCFFPEPVITSPGAVLTNRNSFPWLTITKLRLTTRPSGKVCTDEPVQSEFTV